MSQRNNSIELEISTLLHGCSSHQEDRVHPVYNKQQLEHSHALGKNVLPVDVIASEFSAPVKSQGKPSNFKGTSEEEETQIIVRGTDIGDIPTEYALQGLGTYVDRRITPGFRYQVRLLGGSDYLFKGQSLHLQSVGMGYGKRITFQGQCLNFNNNYFYSDTHPYGYGFKLVAVNPGDKFVILSSSGYSIGEAQVQEVLLQHEVGTSGNSDGTVDKCIKVSMLCRIDCSAHSQRLLPIWMEEHREITGMAVLRKNKKCPTANLLFIDQVTIPLVGSCTLEAVPAVP